MDAPEIHGMNSTIKSVMTRYNHSDLYRRLLRKERELERVVERLPFHSGHREAGTLTRIRNLIVRIHDREQRRVQGRNIFTGRLEGTP